MTPVGTLKHRNYLCPTLEPERVKFAHPGLRHKARLNDNSDLAMERAFMPDISNFVPAPSREATFRWHLEPPGGVLHGKVYTDCSRLDGPTALLARNGWAFVAVDDDQIYAIAYGLPPDWIEDIPCNEAWALLQAAARAILGTFFFVDCQPCVDAVHKGAAFARSDKNPLARVHTMLAEAMNDVPPEFTVWIPSHMKPGSCRTVTRGDGFLMPELDVEMNDIADKYAKQAVSAHRAPYRVRAEIKAHDDLTTANAMWVARAALLANQRTAEPTRDTQASRVKTAAAAA